MDWGGLIQPTLPVHLPAVAHSQCRTTDDRCLLEPTANSRRCRILLLCLFILFSREGFSQENGPVLPFTTQPPRLEDFLDMEPPSPAGDYFRFTGFRQFQPGDGDPASQSTEVYACYDRDNLYMVWVAHDSDPDAVKARLTRRDALSAASDDFVEVTLDTFQDQRRGVLFAANPFGIQQDALWTEGGRRVGGPNDGGRRRGVANRNDPDSNATDTSFDTVWHSRGALTDSGYVVWMAIPFKSLRFPTGSQQSWGITLKRSISRTNEASFWPYVSNRIAGRLNQAATIQINHSISPGRNIQLIPFGIFRSFRTLDRRDPQEPTFQTDFVDPDAGLDAKIVLKDKFALDLALNPDFSQVESDEPQVTVNQRFEVFFPEKRPFFLENANFFQTPLALVFTRRIIDPQLGVRLTGKSGPWALGGMVIDDESPGKTVAPDDVQAGSRAFFGIFRVSRDFGDQSNLGVIFTDREYRGNSNRVGGVDGRWRIDENWSASFQGVASSTRADDDQSFSGRAFQLELGRSGRHLSQRTLFQDISPGFSTEAGFVRRTDVRRIQSRTSYTFRPETRLISWEPIIFYEAFWDHDGTRLDYEISPRMNFELTRQNRFGFAYREGRERVRPEDFPLLVQNRDFEKRSLTTSFSSNYFSWLGLFGRFQWAKDINFVPPLDQVPFPANAFSADVELSFRPTTQLRIDTSYLGNRLRDRRGRGTIFNNHIFRSRWNWQFNREISFRTILQYDAILANAELTALESRKRFNVDLLFTYLVNPWTVLHIGYNSNSENLELVESPFRPNRVVRTGSRFFNDGRQFFVKFSYLLRF